MIDYSISVFLFPIYLNSSITFFCTFSFIDTGNSQDNRGREGTIYIPLFHFSLLRHLICSFASEITISYFQLQYMSIPVCYVKRFINLAINLLFL